MCPKHGTDFLEYKCRYCCSVAVFFCFGTTHFCNACHDDFQRVTNIPKAELPHCPAGIALKKKSSIFASRGFISLLLSIICNANHISSVIFIQHYMFLK